MSTSAPVLLAAAAGVGAAHAVLPDHWMPLATVGRTRGYPLRRIARLAGLAGLGHVLLSAVLGAVLIAVGLQFRHAIESAQGAIVGGLLVVTGAAFLALQARGHDHGPGGHSHPHDHDGDRSHGHDHDGAHHPPGRLAVLVPFGAAASPDLTILPVFLAASAVGGATAAGTLLLFAAATILTFVGLTVVAAAGGYRVRGDWLERRGDLVTGVVLVAIGALVAAGLL